MKYDSCMVEVEEGCFVDCFDTTLDHEPCEDCKKKMETKRGSEE